MSALHDAYQKLAAITVSDPSEDAYLGKMTSEKYKVQKLLESIEAQSTIESGKIIWDDGLNLYSETFDIS